MKRSDRSTTARRPRRWLAVVLSVLWPGLGHAYAGHWLRGVAIAAAVTLVLTPIGAAWALSAPRLVLAASVLLAVLVPVAVSVDAVRCCAAPGARPGRARVSRACFGFILVTLTAQLLVDWARDHYLSRSYFVPSGAMLPTLLIGDHLLIDPRAYARQGPSRGDVVVFVAARDGGRIVPRDQQPEAPTESFIKRVVGLPGDTIAFEGATLYVDGAPVTGPGRGQRFTDPDGEVLVVRPERLDGRHYHVLDHPGRAGRASFPPVVVEPDRYFVSGDNRDNSNDSRYWGTVHRDDILGEARTLYWSWDFRESSARLLDPRRWIPLLADDVRWDRLGRAIE